MLKVLQERKDDRTKVKSEQPPSAPSNVLLSRVGQGDVQQRTLSHLPPPVLTNAPPGSAIEVNTSASHQMEVMIHTPLESSQSKESNADPNMVITPSSQTISFFQTLNDENVKPPKPTKGGVSAKLYSNVDVFGLSATSKVIVSFISDTSVVTVLLHEKISIRIIESCLCVDLASMNESIATNMLRILNGGKVNQSDLVNLGSIVRMNDMSESMKSIKGFVYVYSNSCLPTIRAAITRMMQAIQSATCDQFNKLKLRIQLSLNPLDQERPTRGLNDGFANPSHCCTMIALMQLLNSSLVYRSEVKRLFTNEDTTPVLAMLHVLFCLMNERDMTRRCRFDRMNRLLQKLMMFLRIRSDESHSFYDVFSRLHSALKQHSSIISLFQLGIILVMKCNNCGMSFRTSSSKPKIDVLMPTVDCSTADLLCSTHVSGPRVQLPTCCIGCEVHDLQLLTTEESLPQLLLMDAQRWTYSTSDNETLLRSVARWHPDIRLQFRGANYDLRSLIFSMSENQLNTPINMSLKDNTKMHYVCGALDPELESVTYYDDDIVQLIGTDSVSKCSDKLDIVLYQKQSSIAPTEELQLYCAEILSDDENSDSQPAASLLNGMSDDTLQFTDWQSLLDLAVLNKLDAPLELFLGKDPTLDEVLSVCGPKTMPVGNSSNETDASWFDADDWPTIITNPVIMKLPLGTRKMFQPARLFSSGDVRICTYNVCSLRALLRKNNGKYFFCMDYDVLVMTEVQAKFDQIAQCQGIKQHVKPYNTLVWNWCSTENRANKAGYSGVAVWLKNQPTGVEFGFHDNLEVEDEGRVTSVFYNDVIIVAVYVPAVHPSNPTTLVKRLKFDARLRKLVAAHRLIAPTIVVGDINVAASRADISCPPPRLDNYVHNEELENNLAELVSTCDAYIAQADNHSITWCPRPLFVHRSKNIGVRLDYVIVSKHFELMDYTVLEGNYGSDHKPIVVTLRDRLLSLNSAVAASLQYSPQNTMMNAYIEDDVLLSPSSHVQLLNSMPSSRDFEIDTVDEILDWVVPLRMCSALDREFLALDDSADEYPFDMDTLIAQTDLQCCMITLPDANSSTVRVQLMQSLSSIAAVPTSTTIRISLYFGIYLATVMVDSGSTLCLVSLSFLRKHVPTYATAIRQCEATPLTLGDGRRITPHGSLFLTFKMKTSTGAFISMRQLFYVLDGLSEPLIIGHRFFYDQAAHRADISYVSQTLTFGGHTIPWDTAERRREPLACPLQSAKQVVVYPLGTMRFCVLDERTFTKVLVKVALPRDMRGKRLNGFVNSTFLREGVSLISCMWGELSDDDTITIWMVNETDRPYYVLPNHVVGAFEVGNEVEEIGTLNCTAECVRSVLDPARATNEDRVADVDELEHTRPFDRRHGEGMETHTTQCRTSSEVTCSERYKTRRPDRCTRSERSSTKSAAVKENAVITVKDNAVTQTSEARNSATTLHDENRSRDQRRAECTGVTRSPESGETTTRGRKKADSATMCADTTNLTETSTALYTSGREENKEDQGLQLRQNSSQNSAAGIDETNHKGQRDGDLSASLPSISSQSQNETGAASTFCINWRTRCAPRTEQEKLDIKASIELHLKEGFITLVNTPYTNTLMNIFQKAIPMDKAKDVEKAESLGKDSHEATIGTKLLSEQTKKELAEAFEDGIPEIIPDYFTNNEIDDAKLPKYMTGFRIDLDKVTITKDQCNQFIHLCCVLPKNRDVLFDIDGTPGKATNFEMKVELNDDDATWQDRLRPSSPADKLEIAKIISLYLQQDLIEASTAPYASRILLVRKKTGRHKIAVCLNALNENVKANQYPLPLMRDTLDCLQNATHISTIDICSAYFSMPVKEEHRDYFSFISHSGLYRWKVCPYGYKNAMAAFCQLMDSTLAGLRWQILSTYVDDIIIYGGDIFIDHCRAVNVTLKRLQKRGLRASISKCLFFQKEVEYLGHLISKQGVKPDPRNVEKIMKAEIKTVSDIRSFIGLSGFYRRWIHRYSQLTRPLFEMIKDGKKFAKLTDDAATAVKTIKEHLTTSPILRHPDFDKQFFLATDASFEGFGAVLQQHDAEAKAYYVVAYASTTLKPTHKKMCIHQLELCAATWAMSHFRAYLIGRKFTLQCDNLIIKHLKRKNPSNALWIQLLEAQEYDFEIVHIAGKKHKGPDFLSRCGARCATCDYETFDKIREHVYMPIQAERLTPSEAFDELNHHSVMDTEVVLQPNTWLEHQQCCDRLKTIATILNKPEEDRNDNEVNKVKCYSSFNKIIYYQPPGSKNEPRVYVPFTLRLLILRIGHGILGHRGCEPVRDLLAKRFYWPKMKDDLQLWIKACGNCQRCKPVRPLRAGYTGRITNCSRPFQLLCGDFVLKVLPESNGFKYCFIVMDVFSRYPFAIPLKEPKGDELGEALFREIYSKFGFPDTLHTDNALSLCGEAMTYIHEKFKVKRTTITHNHPQGNGVVERFMRFLNGSFTVMIERYSEWTKVLPFIMFSYRIMKHETTGFTPHYLLFGREPTLPFELTFHDKEHFQDYPKEIGAKKRKQYIDKMIACLKSTYLQVRRLQDRAYMITRARRDENRFEVDFKIGDPVLYFDPKGNDATFCATRKDYEHPDKIPFKWKFNWSGPHIISGRKSKNVYLIYHTRFGRIHSANVDSLLPYHPFSDKITDTSPPSKEYITRKANEPNQNSRKRKRAEPAADCHLQLKEGDLCIIYLAKDSEIFSVARFLGVKKSDLLHVQWLGQYRFFRNLKYRLTKNGWLEGWYIPKNHTWYWSSAKQHESHQPFTEDESAHTVRREDVILHGFGLNQDKTLPRGIAKIAEDIISKRLGKTRA